MPQQRLYLALEPQGQGAPRGIDSVWGGSDWVCFVATIEAVLRFESGFGFRATAKTPGGVDDFRGHGGFHCAWRGELVMEILAAGVVSGWRGEEILHLSERRRQRNRGEKRPNVVALRETRAFPSAVRGPMEASALRRLPAIQASVDIRYSFAATRVTDENGDPAQQDVQHTETPK